MDAMGYFMIWGLLVPLGVMMWVAVVCLILAFIDLRRL
jgi:hypothetical protein